MKRNVFALLRTFALVALVPTFSILVGCDPEIGEEVGNGSDTPSDSIVDNTGNGGIPSDSIPGGGGIPTDSIPGGNGDVPSDSIPSDEGGGNYEGIVSMAGVNQGITYLSFWGYINLDLLPRGNESVEYGFEVIEANGEPLRTTATEVSGDVYGGVIGGLMPGTEYEYRPFATIDGVYYYGEGGTIATEELENEASAYVDEITHNSAAVEVSTGYGCSSREAINLGVAWATSESDLCAGGNFKHYSMPWNEVKQQDYWYKIATSMEGLSPHTTYYYASFVEAGGIYVFSSIKSFTTERYFPSGAVDLGLSVKWAGCNLDAEQPEEFGGYYAWGETKEKETYTWTTYQYYESDGDGFVSEEEMTFIGNSISGTTYDVAHVKLGDGWRMPTFNEAKELLEECTSERITYYGVVGIMITGPNGNAIFFPEAGYYDGSGYNNDKRVLYWTGTYSKEENADGTEAYCLSFRGSGSYYSYNRFCGFTIRPVIE